MSYLPYRWISHWTIKNNYLFDCQWKTVDDFATFPYLYTEILNVYQNIQIHNDIASIFCIFDEKLDT